MNCEHIQLNCVVDTFSYRFSFTFCPCFKKRLHTLCFLESYFIIISCIKFTSFPSASNLNLPERGHSRDKYVTLKSSNTPKVSIKCHCFLHLPPPKNLLCEYLIIIQVSQSPSVLSIYRSLSYGSSVTVCFSSVHIATLYRLVLVLVGHLPFVTTIIFSRIFSDLKCNELLYWSVNNSLLSTFREYLQLGTSD